MGTTLKKGNKTFFVEAIFYYQVECAFCGGRSIAGLSPEEAVEIAAEHGWRELSNGKMICGLCDAGMELGNSPAPEADGLPNIEPGEEKE